jgi:hypothetical protein
MDHNVEGLVTQITRAFTFGGLHEYLKNTPQPDIDIISEYLSAIEQGDDLYHRDEDAQVKAYAPAEAPHDKGRRAAFLFEIIIFGHKAHKDCKDPKGSYAIPLFDESDKSLILQIFNLTTLINPYIAGASHFRYFCIIIGIFKRNISSDIRCKSASNMGRLYWHGCYYFC